MKNEGTTPVEGKLDRFLITKEYYELKTRIHDRLLSLIDLSLLDSLEENVLRQEIRKLVERILAEEKNSIPLNFNERERLFKEIQYEVMGLGPLEPFMQDPTVSDILANMPETPRLLSLGMNGILSKLRQVEPGEAEQIPT
jgi:pilus assembly protein CpaF